MFQRTTALAALAAGILGLAAMSASAQPEKKAKPEDQAKAMKEWGEVYGVNVYEPPPPPGK